MKIQIGNDFALRIRVFSGGVQERLEVAQDIVVSILPLDAPHRRYIVCEHEIIDNEIRVQRIPSSAISLPGDYRISVRYFLGNIARYAEASPAFTIVLSAAEAEGSYSVSADMEIAIPPLVIAPPADNILSETSTNPVQNRVVTSNIQNLASFISSVAENIPQQIESGNVASAKKLSADGIVFTPTNLHTMESLGKSNKEEIATLKDLITEAEQRGRQLAKRDLYIAAGAQYNDTGTDIDKGNLKDTTGAEVKTCFDADGNLMYEEDGETLKYTTVPVIHKAGHYYLNGIGDLTESDMDAIYAAGKLSATGDQYYNLPIRTNIPSTLGTSSYFVKTEWTNSFLIAKQIEAIRWRGTGNVFGVFSSTFWGCANLRYILSVLTSPYGDSKFDTTCFQSCPKLTHLKIHNIRGTLKLSKSNNASVLPYLSEDCVIYMIQNVQKNVVASTTTPNNIMQLGEELCNRLKVDDEESAVYKELEAANAAVEAQEIADREAGKITESQSYRRLSIIY